MKRAAVLLAALVSVSCAGILTKSDKAWLDDRLASRIFHEDRFERLCPPVGSPLPAGPPGCLTMKALLDEWEHANTIANAVQQKGSIPREEKREMNRIVKRVRKLP